jgi:hypothetical protein
VRIISPFRPGTDGVAFEAGFEKNGFGFAAGLNTNGLRSGRLGSLCGNIAGLLEVTSAGLAVGLAVSSECRQSTDIVALSRTATVKLST